MPKLERNLARDKETRERLLAAGWQILVVWECETRDETELTKRLRSFLGPPGIVLNGTEELGAVTSGRG